MSHNYPLPKTLYSSFFFIIAHYLLLQTSRCVGHNKSSPDHSCPPSLSCGNIHNIGDPFFLKNDPKPCGNPDFELACENNTTFIYLDIHDQHKYVVRAINYSDHTIRVTDPFILQNDSCSLPNYSIPTDKFRGGYPYPYEFMGGRWMLDINIDHNTSFVTFMSCQTPLKNSLLLEVSADCSHCKNLYGSDRKHTYIKFGDFNGSDIMDNCTIDLTTLLITTSILPPEEKKNIVPLSQIHTSLLFGFELSYRKHEPVRSCIAAAVWGFQCGDHGILLWFEVALTVVTYFLALILGYGSLLYLGLRILLGMCCMMWFLIYKFRRRHLSTFDVIEGFLQTNHNLMPIRYSYRDIKIMTRGFKEKLGQGGYGSVYKGKLRSGHIVAVKLLSKPKENGQDFINEIATIGRIHHVNVVKLVGFCVGRFNNKRALVFDFMPNGSLEKHIFTQHSPNARLSWEKKYEIAVGVAHGIEYLHRGCDIQILHFDIKPHNILLDDNFTPKISDFGLAKLYAIDNNTVTLTAVRGTIGYVAPELINRSLGGVSYKADVYSFGMLLMEMVGLNRDIMANDAESSQYFPDWIYKGFNKGKDIEIRNADIQDVDGDDDSEWHEKRIMRKMTIVGLWCIQMSPIDRPSMSEVVKMLESDENLQIPPQPSESSQAVNCSCSDQTWDIESSGSMALLCGDLKNSGRGCMC